MARFKIVTTGPGGSDHSLEMETLRGIGAEIVEVAGGDDELAKAVAERLSHEDPSVELLVVCKETQQRLALYMSACDALIFPSYQEGSPNVVKQAMACNLPIVATDVGDVRLVIGKTRGCHVCNPTVSEFAARIIEILSPPRRTDGRDRIRHLDSSTVSERIIEVYEGVLRNREKRFAGRKRPGVVATANKLT